MNVIMYAKADIHLFAAPDFDSEKLADVERGGRVLVTGKVIGKHWYRVHRVADAGAAYTPAENLGRTLVEATSPPERLPDATLHPINQWNVAARSTWVKSEPRYNAMVFKLLQSGDDVFVTARAGTSSWLQVQDRQTRPWRTGYLLEQDLVRPVGGPQTRPWRTGYLLEQDLVRPVGGPQPERPPDPEPVEVEATQVAPMNVVMYATMDSHLFASPEFRSEKLARVERGSKVLVTGKVIGKHWYRVHRVADAGAAYTPVENLSRSKMSASRASGIDKWYVAKRGVRVVIEPRLGAETVTFIDAGADVYVVDRVGQTSWLIVRVRSDTGVQRLGFVVDNDLETRVPGSSQEEESVDAQRGWNVIKRRVRVVNEPRLGAGTVTFIDAGTDVYVVDRVGQTSWLEVRVGDSADRQRTGYLVDGDLVIPVPHPPQTERQKGVGVNIY
jgi:uncharacterized protein YgiM (DUF1202 family)